MDSVELEHKAKVVSDLALAGQGCALQQQINSLNAGDTLKVWALAQKETDKQVAQTGKLPFVQFSNLEPSKGFAHVKADLIDQDRDTIRTELFNGYRGFVVFGAEKDVCRDLKKKPI